jgi:hypothetical protein
MEENKQNQKLRAGSKRAYRKDFVGDTRRGPKYSFNGRQKDYNTFIGCYDG